MLIASKLDTRSPPPPPLLRRKLGREYSVMAHLILFMIRQINIGDGDEACPRTSPPVCETARNWK